MKENNHSCEAKKICRTSFWLSFKTSIWPLLNCDWSKCSFAQQKKYLWLQHNFKTERRKTGLRRPANIDEKRRFLPMRLPIRTPCFRYIYDWSCPVPWLMRVDDMNNTEKWWVPRSVLYLVTLFSSEYFNT